MRKFSIVLLVYVLFFWNCSSSQEKECVCPPVSESQSQEEKSKDSQGAAATRSGEADQQSSKLDESAKSEGTGVASKSSEQAKSGEAQDVATQSKEDTQPTAYPNPKNPIAKKPLNEASSLLGGSGEASAASRQGGTQAEQPSSRDQIRKIDRESDYVIPPQVLPLKGTSTQPAPQKGAGSPPQNLGFKCEDYNEDTKSVVCKGNTTSLKGDALLEFDARKFKKLFFGFDLTLRSGELEVQIPGQPPTKATPSKPFVYLGEVQSVNDKVQVRLKADPNEVQGIDFIVRLLYHGKG